MKLKTRQEVIQNWFLDDFSLWVKYTSPALNEIVKYSLINGPHKSDWVLFERDAGKAENRNFPITVIETHSMVLSNVI